MSDRAAFCLCLAIIGASIIVVIGLTAVAEAIKGHKPDVRINVPQHPTKVEVIREGLPLPIREAGL